MKRSRIITAILYLTLVYGLAALSSCGKEAATQTPNQYPDFSRAAINLETGEHTWVQLTRMEYFSVQDGDSVWVNPDTHRIDNDSDTTMQFVLGEILTRSLH